MNPGDTSAAEATCAYLGSLNEGRGVNPGDTPVRRRVGTPSPYAQRRPGREPRRHATTTRRARSGTTALNEGRGVNPGDTLPYSHVELRFAQAISGPVVIGSGRQRGFGLCVPVDEVNGGSKR